MKDAAERINRASGFAVTIAAGGLDPETNEMVWVQSVTYTSLSLATDTDISLSISVGTMD